MTDTTRSQGRADAPSDRLNLKAQYENFLDQAFLHMWPAVKAPGDSARPDENLSGVACAILVMRTALTFLEAARAPVVEAFGTGTVKILDLAVGRADEAAIQAFCQDWAAGNNGPLPPSFMELVEHREMWRSFWALKYFHFRKLMVSDDDDNSEPKEVLLEQTYVEWDGRESLSDHLKRSFGPYAGKTRYKTAIVVPGSPEILRVKLVISDKDTPKLNFVTDVKRFKHAGAVYRCVAIVRLRDHPAGEDTMRMYFPPGAPFWANGGAYPLCDTWHIPDPGQYMIYYLRTEIPIAPEEPVFFDKKTYPYAESYARFGKIFLDKALSVLSTPAPAPARQSLPDPVVPPRSRQVAPPRPGQGDRAQGQSRSGQEQSRPPSGPGQGDRSRTQGQSRSGQEQSRPPSGPGRESSNTFGARESRGQGQSRGGPEPGSRQVRLPPGYRSQESRSRQESSSLRSRRRRR
ncbi:hypothetical protein VTJ04DRAFT_4099 [Mycothermus thermophilus]|uniref:uncharacterized protein n=1 Tax=Humicola insolens TaxID=85995 RepID=UPI00374391AD